MPRYTPLSTVLASLSLLVVITAPATAASTNLLSDDHALAAFIDGIATNRMEKHHIPGAVVTVVKGDRIVFNKGYGFANLEQHTPVDPEKTLFRIASVSKVFNAMTVMRLVDEGLLNVDEDVLPRFAAAGLELDKTAQGPITLKALLTHTAGIRDEFIDNLTTPEDPARLLPLGTYLQKSLPLRWQAPGESVLYTDHGISLAGYVAELASKTNFQESVMQRVLRPLGMNHTGYTISDAQRTNLAVAYSYADSRYQPKPFFYSNIDPAVGVLTTGSDMARLMSSHLSDCKGFLKPTTLKLMHEPQHADDPRQGFQWTCGLVYETHPKLHEPFLFHVGGAFGFQSVVGISLKRGVGVFLSQSRFGPRAFQLLDLLDAIADAKGVLPSPPPQPPSSISAAEIENLKSLAGIYVLNRTLSYGFKLSEENYVHVRYAPDIEGLEVEHGQMKGHPMRLIQTEPLLFRSVKGEERLSFRTSKDGKTTWLFDSNMRGDGAYKRISTSDHL